MQAASVDSIGARLRSARERAGLTTLQAASKLHLEPRLLEALEGNEFAFLGAPVYVRGHLKRYADLVGAPADELLDLYAKQEGATKAPDLTRFPQAQAVQAPRQLAGPVIAVIVACAVIAGIWLALKGLPLAPRPATSGPVATTQAPVVETERFAPASSAATAPDTVPAPAVLAPTTPPIDSAAPLALAFSSQSWVEVYDARNTRLAFGMGEPQTSRNLGGTPPWRILLGNVDGATVRVNGQVIGIPDSVRRGRAAQFRLSADGTIVGTP